jgi:hypothetical protein
MDVAFKATATPKELSDGLGWAVQISWPAERAERSETVFGFLSEAEANAWIKGCSAAWISRTEALRKALIGEALIGGSPSPWTP